eukprot:TRINITY_DN12085_c3_g2_i3.p1 TRINITY_DN12085_c3_g2~~TRINITY_DN12085_c3_g2_i3.p1  ORF type:complete len:708 (+),score=177.65 TRINITY_DN12085_c3_g2_i3:35-2158(+)
MDDGSKRNRGRRLPPVPPSSAERLKQRNEAIIHAEPLPSKIDSNGTDPQPDISRTTGHDTIQLRKRIKSKGSFRRSQRPQSLMSDTSKLESLLAKQQRLEKEVQSAHTTVTSDTHSLKDQLYARNEDLRRENQDLRESLELLKKQTTEEIAMRTMAEREAAKLIEQIFADHNAEEVEVTPEMVTNLASSLRSVMVQLDQAKREVDTMQAARDQAEARIVQLLDKDSETPLTAYEELKDWQQKRADELKKTIEILKREVNEKSEQLEEQRRNNQSIKDELEAARTALSQAESMTTEASNVASTRWTWNEDEMTFRPDRPQTQAATRAADPPRDNLRRQLDDAMQQRDQALEMLRDKTQELLNMQQSTSRRSRSKSRSRQSSVRTPSRMQSFVSNASSMDLGRFDKPDAEEIVILERQLDFHRRQQASLQAEVHQQANKAHALQAELLASKQEAAKSISTAYRQAEKAMPVTAAEAYAILSCHQNETQTYLASANVMRKALQRIADEVQGTTAAFAAQVLQTIDADALDQRLPAHWEQRRTASGLVYYVDHDTKSSSWLNPLFGTAVPIGDESLLEITDRINSTARSKGQAVSKPKRRFKLLGSRSRSSTPSTPVETANITGSSMHALGRQAPFVLPPPSIGNVRSVGPLGSADTLHMLHDGVDPAQSASTSSNASSQARWQQIRSRSKHAPVDEDQSTPNAIVPDREV